MTRPFVSGDQVVLVNPEGVEVEVRLQGGAPGLPCCARVGSAACCGGWRR